MPLKFSIWKNTNASIIWALTSKTKVMSLVLAGCFFHKLYETGSTLARNFFLITPNIIVLDRICSDFEGLRIFFEDPVLPDNGFDGQNWASTGCHFHNGKISLVKYGMHR